MDDHLCSTTRKQRERANGSDGRPIQHIGRNLRAEEDPQRHKGDRTSSRLDATRGKQSQATLQSQLSGDDNYIRGWLAQTDEETNEMSTALHLTRQRTHNRDQPKTHVEAAIRYPTIIGDLTSAPTRKKRKHNTSSDSSLLEAPIEPQRQPQNRSKYQKEGPRQEEESPKTQKRQKIELPESELSTSSSESSAPKKETFEKRARHKTREDRYESKRKKKHRPDEEPKRPRKKREKKGDRKKAAKKAGEELMRTFSSKSIGQERLTMRPSHGAGLFKNGRASSPVRRRGIPDLAFSEMDFLQRSTRNVASTKGDMGVSKSRGKKRRRAARAQEEMSNFFKPNRVPLKPIQANRDSVVSSDTKDHQSRDSDREDTPFLRQPYDGSRSFDIHRKSNANSGNARPPPDILSASIGRSLPTNRPQKVPESAGKLSERETSYVSWSETQVSHSRNFSKVGRKGASLTPELIRRSLENSGIFRDTGISIAARRAVVSYYATDSSPKKGQVIRAEPSARSSISPESMERMVPHGRVESHRSTSRHSEVEKNEEDTNTKEADHRADDASRKRERVIIEHFDPKSGGHELSTVAKQVQGSAEAPSVEVSEKCKSVPLNREEREELAKIARIKRPSTTAPLSRRSPASASMAGNADRGIQDQTTMMGRPKQQVSADGTAQVAPEARRDILDGKLDKDAHPNLQTSMLAPRGDLNKPPAPELQTMTEERIQSPHLSNPESVSPGLGNAMESIQRTNSLFLGLPVRGFSAERVPVHHSLQMNPPITSGLDHQLQRQFAPLESSMYDEQAKNDQYEGIDIFSEGREEFDVDLFSYNNIPQEVEYGRFDDAGLTYADNLQPTYEVFEEYGYHPNEVESWQANPSHVDVCSTHYEHEDLAQESYYENGAEDRRRRQPLTNSNQVYEQEDGYGQYVFVPSDDVQVFWHQHQQY